MSGRRVKNPWILLGQVNENPVWRQRYADRDADWQFADNTDWQFADHTDWQFADHTDWQFADYTDEPGMESEWEDVPFSSPASSSSPPLRAPWTRSSQRRARGAAVFHPYKAWGYRQFRAPFSRRPRCGGCSNCGLRRYMPVRCRPRGYKPTFTSWEHLPVVIQPTKWYQVVGSMQCSHCRDQGRHQMTSWICQSCQVPLCLLPYRNCYAKWHGQGC